MRKRRWDEHPLLIALAVVWLIATIPIWAYFSGYFPTGLLGR